MSDKEIVSAIFVTPEMIAAAERVFYQKLFAKELREPRDRWVAIREMIEAALEVKESK